MSLAVSIQPDGRIPRSTDRDECVCSLDNDGYYWFLHPLFEQLAQQTGQYIDLYGYAAFGGSDLDELRRTLAAARRLVEGQPDQWQVVIGHGGIRLDEPILAVVGRAEMRRLLEELDAAASKARVGGEYLTFFGD